MSKKKKRKNSSSSGKQPWNSGKPSGKWGLIVALTLGLGIVAAVGYAVLNKPAPAAEKDVRDKYGRPPSHAHYKHDHP